MPVRGKKPKPLPYKMADDMVANSISLADEL